MGTYWHYQWQIFEKYGSGVTSIGKMFIPSPMINLSLDQKLLQGTDRDMDG
jgi:hypothetical protein